MTDVETRYGRLTVPDTEADIICRFLQRYGEWAWIEAGFVASLLKDGDRVLDVGAFAGTFGLGVAQIRELGFLCMVEANPLMAPLLAANVAGKTIFPVAVLEALVTGPEGNIRPGHAEPGNLGSATFRQDGEGEPIPASSSAVTLAGLRAMHGDFDLIKLDVEGMELEILQGDAAYLANGQTLLWIECNEDERSMQVAELLLSWGLELHYFAFPSFNPGNFNRDPDPIFPLAFEAALLAGCNVTPTLDAEQVSLGCVFKTVGSVEDLRDALWLTPRWGLREWEGTANRMEMAARLARSLRSENRETFLRSGVIGEPPLTLWQQLERAQTRSADVERILEAERCARHEIETRLLAEQANATELADRANAAETALVRASNRSLAHLAGLGALRERAAALELRLQAEAIAADTRYQSLRDGAEVAFQAEREEKRIAKQALADFLNSTVWRLSAPLRRLVDAMPGLHALLRRGRFTAGSIRRRLRR